MKSNRFAENLLICNMIFGVLAIGLHIYLHKCKNDYLETLRNETKPENEESYDLALNTESSNKSSVQFKSEIIPKKKEINVPLSEKLHRSESNLASLIDENNKSKARKTNGNTKTIEIFDQYPPDFPKPSSYKIAGCTHGEENFLQPDEQKQIAVEALESFLERHYQNIEKAKPRFL